MTCKQCWKQYLKQWKNYKNNATKFLRGKRCIQQHLFEHFQSPGHTGFVEDVCIPFVDKTDPFIPAKGEDYWRQTLKTFTLHGLNVEESV